MRTIFVIAGSILAVILFITLFAPDPRQMSERERELFVTAAPAKCQRELHAAFAAREQMGILPGRAQSLRDSICPPDVVVVHTR